MVEINDFIRCTLWGNETCELRKRWAANVAIPQIIICPGEFCGVRKGGPGDGGGS